MQKKKLKDVAEISLSNVDKRSYPEQKHVKLCNYTDVYYNQLISSRTVNSLMTATASEIEIRKFQLKRDDVVLTKDSETKDDIGIAAYIDDVPEDVVLGYHCALIRPKQGLLCGKYLGAFLQSKYTRKYFELNATGSGQRFTLSLDVIENFPILLPDMPIQGEIGGLLFDIDKKIELNKVINENLQRQLRLLYDYWFVQFDFPSENGDPYRVSGGKMLWNKSLKREIPYGWEVKELTNNPLTSIISPGVDQFTTKTYLDTASVDGTDISSGSEIDYETRETRANMQPKEYSVWFAKMKNSVKHLYLNPAMAPVIQGAILSTGFCGLQCSKTSFEYIASYIEYSYFENSKNAMAHGATQEAVNLDDLSLIPLLVPSIDVLHAYHDTTQSIYAQISNNVCENEELMRLRDWLLPLLMNGQATVA